MNEQTMRTQIAVTILLYISAFSTSVILWGWNMKAVMFANILFLNYSLLCDDEQGE